MKIERKTKASMSIEEFADMYVLTMVIVERDLPKDEQSKYYAYFKNSEVRKGIMLSGSYGNGSTEDEAIRNYAKEISGKCLVIDAYKTERRDINVPHLV